MSNLEDTVRYRRYSNHVFWRLLCKLYKQTLTEEHGGDPMQFVRKQGALFFIFEYLILCSFFSNMVPTESSEMIMTLMTVKVFGKLLN